MGPISVSNLLVHCFDKHVVIFFKCIYISVHPREKIAKMACFNKPNQLHCIYKPY